MENYDAGVRLSTCCEKGCTPSAETSLQFGCVPVLLTASASSGNSGDQGDICLALMAAPTAALCELIRSDHCSSCIGDTETGLLQCTLCETAFKLCLGIAVGAEILNAH